MLAVSCLGAVALAARVFPDPITHPNRIVALQARVFPGSQIKLERQLKNGVNCRQWIASYQFDGLKILTLLTMSAYTSAGYMIDVMNAISSIKTLTQANPSKVGLWGHIGGYLTLRALTLGSGAKAAVIWCGRTTFGDF